LTAYTAQKIQVEADLAASQEQLDQAIADKAYYQKLLEERLSVMYMYENTGYLDVLFGATSFFRL
jgi:peptidoglycan hydrolase CwlO-like protein